MFDKATPAPPPDMTPIANLQKETAEHQLQLQQQQFDWAKQAYAENKATGDQVTQKFLDAQDENQKWAEQDRARYQSVFQPQEDALVNDANTYNTEAKHDQMRGRAVADVNQQFTAARNAATQNLEGYGIDPSATRYAALDLGFRTQQAATAAGAANNADLQTDATARALRDEAINVGRGYPGQIAGTQNTANQSGTGAVNTNLSTTASGANTMGTSTQYAGLGYQGLTGAGNTLTQGYNNSLAYNNAQNAEAQGWGQAIGTLAGAGIRAYGNSNGPGMASFFAADGGAIPDDGSIPMEHTPGGTVHASASPSGGAAIDDVSARLTAGEFVLPKDVTSWLGEEKLQKMIQKARQDKMGAGAKPTVGSAPAQSPTFQSRPQQRQALAA